MEHNAEPLAGLAHARFGSGPWKWCSHRPSTGLSGQAAGRAVGLSANLPKTLVFSMQLPGKPPKADIETQSRNVRFVPKADIATNCTALEGPASRGRSLSLG